MFDEATFAIYVKLRYTVRAKAATTVACLWIPECSSPSGSPSIQLSAH
jgi:hypothetical protein